MRNFRRRQRVWWGPNFGRNWKDEITVIICGLSESSANCFIAEPSEKTTVQVLEISIDFIYNLTGLELIRDRFPPSFGPPVCRSDRFFVRVVWKHRLSMVLLPEMGCQWVKTIWEVGKITYLKRFGVNLITYIHPRSFALVKKSACLDEPSGVYGEWKKPECMHPEPVFQK